MKYRKKPVEVDVIQWVGSNIGEMREFMKPNYPCLGTEADPDCLLIHTLEGTMKARVNDWIIRGVKGEYYPCKPRIFNMTYEKVEATK